MTTQKARASGLFAYLEAGRDWLAKGRPRRAGAAFRKLLEQEPQHAEALAGLETAIGKLRDLANAARRKSDVRTLRWACQSVLSLQTKPDPLDLYRFGNLLHQSGERAAALPYFRRAAATEGANMVPLKAKRGDDPRVAVVGFTGFHGKLGIAGMDFLKAAQLTRYSRLILWDSSYRFFLGGLPGLAKGCDSLAALIRSRLTELAPRKVVVVGCSGNGFPALLYGHALGADVVHAFSPAVGLDLPVVERIQPGAAKQFRELMIEIAASGVDRKLLHLPDVLARDNGKTRYFIHYGRGNRDDAERAHFMAGLPGVHLIEHDTREHGTAELLAAADQLSAVFTTEDPAKMPRGRAG